MSKIYTQLIADLNSYYFENDSSGTITRDEVEKYQRLKNSSDIEQKLWLMKQVMEGNIRIVNFHEEWDDE